MPVPPVHHSIWITAIDAGYNFIHSKWGLVTEAASGTAAVVKAWPSIWEKYETFRDFRSLKHRLGADLYTQQDLIWATKYYIEPDCQLTDPAGQEDFRKLAPMRTSAHKALANLLDEHSNQRFMILLADSGMGKSTLLMNLYAKYGRNKGNYYLIPLGRPDADELIKKVRHKTSSILFLDAFDEDTKAIRDYKIRLAELVELSKDFCRVVMTCRTQFFETDAEIPQETGVVRIGAVGVGKAKVYTFSKLYLSPFSERQIDRYLKKRFPFWQRKARNSAKEMVVQASDLTMRPMLLSHIPELVDSGAVFTTASELYEAMTQAWFQRESSFVNPQALKEFSTALAVEIFGKRESRGSESVSASEALFIAQKMEIPLTSWQFRGRSLLNRTGDGRLKFSHRSLLEYFFAIGFLDGAKVEKTIWTDQLKRFWWEMVAKEFQRSSSRRNDSSYLELASRVHGAKTSGDISHMSNLGFEPFVKDLEGDNMRLNIIAVRDRGSEVGEYMPFTLLLEKLTPSDPLHLAFTHTARMAGLWIDELGTVIFDLMRGLIWKDELMGINVEGVNESRFSPAIDSWRIPTFQEVSTLRRWGTPDCEDRYPNDLFSETQDVLLCRNSYGEFGFCHFIKEGTDCFFSAAKPTDFVKTRLVAWIAMWRKCLGAIWRKRLQHSVQPCPITRLSLAAVTISLETI